MIYKIFAILNFAISTLPSYTATCIVLTLVLTRE